MISFIYRKVKYNGRECDVDLTRMTLTWSVCKLV